MNHWLATALAIAALSGTACERDVRLGGASTLDADVVVATVDAAVSEAPGFSLQLGALYPAQCDGSLVGRETDFDGWNAIDAGFVGGHVELTWQSDTFLRVAGAPMVDIYQMTAMDLVANFVPEQPPEILASIVSVAGGAPAGMTKEAGMLSVDRTSVEVDQVLGQAGMLYIDSSGDGTCALTVDVTFHREL